MRKGEAVPVKERRSPQGSRLLEFLDNHHMQAARLSAQRTGRLYPPENIPGTHFCHRLSPSQDHSAAGRIVVKNPSDIIRNRTHGLPACNAVIQPTAPPRTSINLRGEHTKFRGYIMLQRGHTKVTEWTGKFRSGHKISGWTESFAVNTHSFWRTHKVTTQTREQNVSRWTQSYGDSVSYEKEFANY